MIGIDATHPRNLLAVETMRRRAPYTKPFALPADVDDPYYESGAHPEIVERMWDQLGKKMEDGRCLLYGTPVLAQPSSGVIVAVAFGTQYIVRIPDEDVPRAMAAGYEQSHDWNDHTTDLVPEFGTDWVFGLWRKEELRWCKAVCERFSAPMLHATMLTRDTPAPVLDKPGALTFRVHEPPDYVPRVIAYDPDPATIETAMRALQWDRITFAVVARDANQFIDFSGSTEDGFSARYVEDGVEHISTDAPDSIEAGIRLLQSYCAGDEEWRRIGWDDDDS